MMYNTLSLTADQKRLIQATFPKILMRSKTVSDLFYSQLFWADQSLIPMFTHSREEQGRHLMHMLSAAISLLDEPEELRALMAELGRRHVAYGVQKKHYPLFGKALLAALERALGEGSFNAEVKSAWVQFFSVIAAMAIEGAYDAV